tara:strand:+ start:245 stop:619 length:375 start_codon:yes stop_codon:yes gene_type:complete
MRKIEDKLCEIVQECLRGNYTKSFSKSLTKRDRVEYDHESSQVTVFLWNSAIVRVDTKERSMIVQSCGYEFNTTKSRLNAFIQYFDPQLGGIFQKNWIWYRWARCALTGEDNPVEFNGKHEFTV